MPELLDTIDTIQQEAASVRNLFADAGTPIAAGRRNTPAYMASLAEAATLIAEVTSGRRPAWQLQEAMTTSDFPQLFGDVLDRQLLANYQEIVPTWQNWVRRSTVRDFRPASRFAVDGLEGPLDEVGERAPYPVGAVAESKDTVQVRKLGRRAGFSFETLINDDLDAFTTFPERLARAARRSEQIEATRLYVGSSGPHTDLYKTTPAGRRNHLAGNPVLDVDGLKAGLEALAGMVDGDGQPIAIDAVELVVPPALEIPALEIINATALEVQTSGSSRKMITANWIRGKVRVNVDPYIPHVAATNGNTSWFLFANPNSGRPAIELAFLRGHEAPALFRKSPNAVLVGGGTADPALGDFDSDSIEFKVRHILGSTQLISTGGWRATVASNGSGS